MSTIKSSSEDLTLNADGSNEVKFQINAVEKASINSSGLFTSTTIDATKLTGNLPAISGASLTNLPASALSPQFYVYDENSDVSLTSGTATKVEFPDTLFNGDSVFDHSNERFTIPSGQAGKYVISARIPVLTLSNDFTQARLKIYKNGSFYHGGYDKGFAANTIMRHHAPWVTFIEDGAVADYYEVYVIASGTSPKIWADSENKKFGYFYGYKIG